MGCLGLLEGKSKYGRSNWRASGVRASIYVDACKRHLDAWFVVEDLSPEGLPHMANALACLAILVDAEANGMLLDDRQYNPKGGYRALVEKLTPRVKQVLQLYADKSPKHWERQDAQFTEVRSEDALHSKKVEIKLRGSGDSVILLGDKATSWLVRGVYHDYLGTQVEAFRINDKEWQS
jgi:hypothetical protein